MNNKQQKVIGRIELVDLPQWNFTDLDAKVDTGAYTSSFHCHHIEEFVESGKKMVRFYLLDPDHPSYTDKLLEAEVSSQKEVKSSNGVTQLRYFVKTKIIIHNQEYDIELSLTDRSEMRYPLLLGRKFLKRLNFLVDVNKKYISKK